MSTTPEHDQARKENAVATVYAAKEATATGTDGTADGTAPPKSRRQRLSDLLTVVCAGVALASDGYQNNLMTMTNVVLKKQYPAHYTSFYSTAVSNALLVGEVLGQIVIGLTCDFIGRKAAITLTTLMIVLGGALATASSGKTVESMFWMMIVARGIIGFGAGGEYPASSTSASEAANARNARSRGSIFIMVTNFPLSFGGPFALTIFLIVFSIWDATSAGSLTTVWRWCFGLGIVWPLFIFGFRVRMMNSELYRKGAIRSRPPYKLILKYYWKTLIGTCGAWFLYDFITFPNGVFSGTIITSVVPHGLSRNETIKTTAEYQLLLGAIALPGVIVGAFLCRHPFWGRKNTMMLGFSGYLLFGLTIGLAYEKITKILPLFIVFYGLMGSMGNLGPGNMLGLLSSECYATGVRGTAYGLSAAIGKVGAAVGVQAFTPIQAHLGKRWTFIFAAICGIAGILVTYFFVPALDETDLAVADEKFRRYLVDNGWDGELGVKEDPDVEDD